ncbi:MAG: GNAT family N-acetyltransferase [Chloroflexi bacterium]|nr:GNAT family N-acetyltransferase [Chloroflexota bacterium]
MSTRARPPRAIAFPLKGERVRVGTAGAGGAHPLVRLRDGEPAGRLVLAAEGTALFVRELCVEPALRGYGLGSEAILLLREAAEACRWHTLRAWAPPDLGLAVYFWSRMGLSPLPGQGPDGGIWFERTLRS